MSSFFVNYIKYISYIFRSHTFLIENMNNVRGGLTDVSAKNASLTMIPYFDVYGLKAEEQTMSIGWVGGHMFKGVL